MNREVDLDIESMLEDLRDFTGGLKAEEIKLINFIHELFERHGYLTKEQEEKLNIIYNSRILGIDNG